MLPGLSVADIDRKVCRIARRYSRVSGCEAEDLAQDAWAAILEKLHEYEPGRAPAWHWIEAMAKRACHVSARRQRRRRAFWRHVPDLDRLPCPPDPGHDPASALRLLANLAPAEEKVISHKLALFTDGEGCGIGHSARSLGLSYAAAHSAYYRGMRKLRLVTGCGSFSPAG